MDHCSSTALLGQCSVGSTPTVDQNILYLGCSTFELTRSYTAMCSGYQVQKGQCATICESIELGPEASITEKDIKEKIITFGYLMLSAAIYCPWPTIQPYKFFNCLLSGQSPWIIIQAT